jgi:peptide/nickel transport system substrate-binding protein
MRKPMAALLVAVALLAACGSEAPVGREGGEIVVAAEQWPECLNPITTCANASWLHWSVLQHILPKAMTFDKDSNFVASPLITEAPTLENEGLTEDPFSVTYKINEDAVWDDGSPITSADFEFTWQSQLKSKGSLTTAGFDKIESIDTSEPKTAVIKFKEPYADWWDLFGGNTTFVIKKGAFKSPDVSAQMKSMIDFSGGPWKLQSWDKQQAVLVRNDAYWGTKPKLERVVFVPRTDQTTEVNALLSGEVSAIYPQPTVTMPDQFDKAGNVEFTVGAGTTYEGLWLNHSKPPLNEKAVREALAYAVNRQAVVDTIIKPINPDAEVLNCAGWVPTVGEWCDNTDFEKYTYDIEKAKSILEGAGWTAGAGGIYSKGGKPLRIEWTTTAGNKGREDTQALVKEQAKAAGFDLVIKNTEAGNFFENKLPKLDFMMGEYAQVASPDPSVASLYPCAQIPSQKNEFSGQNYTAWCNEDADKLVADADREVDPEKRAEIVHQIGDVVAQDIVWIPLYQKPLITAWRTDRVAGPLGDFNTTPLASFQNLHEWGAAG